MANEKTALPDLLEVVRSDGTVVMDCNAGMALLSIRPHRDDAADDDRNSDLVGRPKSKITRN
jgi:hypothetical protein